MNYIAANGKKIPNLGEKVISAVTQEGIETSMRFQICPVTKALGSVSRMTKNGQRVVFNGEDDPEGSYIENRITGSRTYMRLENG
eukprot:9400404-Karenia_brevis.AAC.1